MHKGLTAFSCCQETPCCRLTAKENCLKSAFILNFARWIQPTDRHMHARNTMLFSFFQSSTEAAEIYSTERTIKKKKLLKFTIELPLYKDFSQ